MKKVTSVEAIEGKKVEILFSDGMYGVFDVTPYSRTDFPRWLEDEEYFRQAGLFFNGIGCLEGPDTIEAEMQITSLWS